MNGWRRWVPGLQVLAQYEAAWFPRDVMAGLVLTAMLVPVGIAYAVASGVPGIYGLYATIVPLLTYAVFGPSRILVLGPDSALAPLILAVVVAVSAGDANRAIAVTRLRVNSKSPESAGEPSSASGPLYGETTATSRFSIGRPPYSGPSSTARVERAADRLRLPGVR